MKKLCYFPCFFFIFTTFRKKAQPVKEQTLSLQTQYNIQTGRRQDIYFDKLTKIREDKYEESRTFLLFR